MASSSVTTTKNYDGRKATLTITESSYSITDNTSTITWTLEVLGGSSNYYNAYEVAAYVNGQTVYGPTTKAWDSKVFPAAKGTKTGTLTITHNPDGTASAVPFSIRGSFFNNNPATVAGTALTLTTIPRASTVSIASSVTTNSAYTITVTPAVTNTFTHVLKYSFGSTSGTIASLNASTTTYSWTVPRSLAAQIPNSTESSAGALIITCETYNGSTLVGSKTCSSKLVVDSGLIPTLSSSSIQDGNATVRGKNWGVYLQNMSYVNVNTMTGTGIQGSSISSYWCTFEGTNYSSTTLAGLNSQIQAKGLPTTGSRTLYLWVVDSRGRLSSKASKSYTVVAYSSPSISSYDAYRTNSSGTATDDGTYFKQFLNCSISSCSNHNPFTVKIRWRVKGSSTDTGSSTIKNATTSESSYNSNSTLGGGNISTSNTYEVIFEVSDAFSTISRSKDIPPAFELLHYHKSGKSVAFGKKSRASDSESIFEVGSGMRAEIGNGIIRTQKSVSWYQGRANAAAVNEKTTDSGYHPVCSAKSKNGDWSIGTYGGDDTLRAIYTTDTNYNAGTNTVTTVSFPTSGGTLALTSQIPSTSNFIKKSDLLTYVYPVGSIYMSTVNTSPASFLGGTWEQLKNGFLYGGTSYGSGNGTGTSTQSHTLTVSEMPSHGHAQSWAGNDHTTNNLVTDKTTGSQSDRNVFGKGAGCRYNSQSAWHNSGATIIGTGTTGGGGGHSHGIPYISVFMWRRTA